MPGALCSAKPGRSSWIFPGTGWNRTALPVLPSSVLRVSLFVGTPKMSGCLLMFLLKIKKKGVPSRHDLRKGAIRNRIPQVQGLLKPVLPKAL